MSNSKLSNAVIVFVSSDVRKTADYYRNVWRCRVVEHFDKEEPFAALYRDAIEIIVVQAKHGEVVSNQQRYGAGHDAYLVPEEVDGVDALHAELKAKGARVIRPPSLTSYGSYECVLEDIDGRRIGIGRVKLKETFFGSAGT